MDQQNTAQPNAVGSVDNSARQNQVRVINFDNQITRAVSSAVLTVENHMHETILTSIDNVVIPRNEVTVKTITVSTGQGTNSEVEHLHR